MTIVPHFLTFTYGLMACVLSVSVFFLAGQVLVPRRWDQSVGRGESSAVLGAAIFAIACWVGIGAGVPLPRIMWWFAVMTGALILIRLRWLWIALRARGLFTVDALSWLLGFSGLYAVAYLYTLPPVTPAELPVAWTGNVDLLTYARYTNYLLHLRPLTPLGASHLDFVYLQTPAVFYFLGWLSQWFRQDTLAAAMPAQFACTALIGTFVARLSHGVFGLSKRAAFGVACILIGGPFFRYVWGAYYLSTLTAMPIVFYLLWTTVTCRSVRLIDTSLVVRSAAAYALLLLTYSALFYVAVGAQVGALALRWMADAQTDRFTSAGWRTASKHAGRALLSHVLPLVTILVAFHGRILWSLDELRSLSVRGIAGWPLDMVSPLALLGAPVVRASAAECAGCWGVSIQHPAYRPLVTATLCAIAGVLLYSYFWRFRERTTPAQRTFAGISAGAFLIYCLFFDRTGYSYQQWKFASYTALPWSFVVFAGGYQLLGLSTALNRRAQTIVGAAVLVALAGGNAVVHAMKDPPLMRLPGALRNIGELDKDRSFRHITVQMAELFGDYGTLLAMHFLPSKDVHPIMGFSAPPSELSWDTVSPTWPLLIQNFGCEGVGHDDTLAVEDVGCVLRQPPSVTMDTVYPFARSFLFIGFQGLADREAAGRWNRRPTVDVRLTADLQRADVRRDAFVNLLIAPAMVPGRAGQRLIAKWGTERSAETSLDGVGWISLAVRSADWRGGRIVTLPLSITFSEAAAGVADARFESLSITLSPTGRTLAASKHREP